MSRAAVTQPTQTRPLYLVTFRNLDGSTKTVLKSMLFENAVSCYELKQEHLNQLWFATQAELPGNRGRIPTVLTRRIALFSAPEIVNHCVAKGQPGRTITLADLDEQNRDHANHIALALSRKVPAFIPIDHPETDNPKDTTHNVFKYSFTLATDILDATLNGDEVIARMLLEKNPSYLLYHGTATDFSNRKYDNLTPFQAALITGDDVMAEMMKPFFEHLPNGEAEMQRQFAEIFPNGIGAHIATQKQNAFNFDAIFNAINTASATEITAALKLEGARFDETDEARAKPNEALNLTEKLNRFREQFTRKSHSEKIFNPHHLLNAFEAYVNKFDWKNPDWNKLDLFWRQVIGFVQRFLPANYAQVFAYGLCDIVNKKHRCLRSFNFRDDPAYSFHPIADSCGGLGFNFGARAVDAGLCRFAAHCGEPHVHSSVFWDSFYSPLVVRFSKLMSSKNSKLLELVMQPTQLRFSCVMQ